jgi:hypothetical protein
MSQNHKDGMRGRDMAVKKAQDAEFKSANARNTPESIALGERMKEAVKHVALNKSTDQKILEKSLCESVGIDANRFSRWYDGIGIVQLAKMAKVLQTLESVRGSHIDLRYILYGTTEDKSKEDLILDRLDRNYNATRYFSDYFRDHELGLEGIMMRHALRMVQELRASRLHESSGSGFDRNHEPLLAGFLQDWQTETVESCSTTIRLALLSLNYGIELDPESDEQRTRLGRSFDVSAQNMSAGNKYDFLLFGSKDKWTPIVEKYLASLEADGHVQTSKLRNATFHVTDQPLGAGFVLMDVDIDKLGTASLILLKELKKDYITDQNQLGILSSASTRTHGNALMDPDRTDDANIAWEKYMLNAKPLF